VSRPPYADSVSIPAELHVSLAEFLAWEQEQDRRHEYVRSEVRLMTGGSARHEALVRRIDRVLGDVYDEAPGPCRVYSHNRKLVMAESVRYPDVMVVCGPQADAQYEDDADYLVEVLSPSTAKVDLSEKLHEYAALRSIKEYMVLDPDVRRVVVYERHELGWHVREVKGTTTFAGVTVDLDAAYEWVDARTGIPS
jgi:Uma2 family endonuclease